ncbi:MAG TPA: ribonuclease P protein component [Gordonia sp. (in: high G+C Gram-positive bacteria)]|uniref:ribonuclease P protein component n=1 Tax=unclassified Gordonia (in: high G+C Gram-positive bacteria) TaxID=2657482 RepID=UPI000FAB8A50|nr:MULTISPECIES: ribonuclease P protein component [unclassified Gordonia (in: high G+C Gram-positive bacteria)]RUP38947.1 MAG: ribonuclease P protein component [Gordonia sp. (in: high G+C Gram-positive bacteria)]HNP56442.1 ribonuclease P protein component [Gordonia sp. (in: high G+C Gram-positive bacteria)]HRC50805.1 ribonuclease P protein component [Gordonia sp. (in: high G+C Gram-positive bacteria)]
MNSAHRIHRRSDFRRTLSQGMRTRTRDLDIHRLEVAPAWPDPTRSDVALCGGPRLGMIVSKKVGNAVVRHRVARCIRTAFGMSVLPVVETESFFVVRARPSAADRSSVELADQLARAVRP